MKPLIHGDLFCCANILITIGFLHQMPHRLTLWANMTIIKLLAQECDKLKKT